MKALVQKCSVCVVFSILLIATYPINYSLFLSLRPVDIVLILFAIWGVLNNDIKLQSFSLLIGIFYILYLLSVVYGVLCIGIVNPQNFAFIYKYSVLFICVWLFLSSDLNEWQVKFLLKILFFSFIALIVYEFVSLYRFKILFPELANRFRPNFPFTKPFYKGGYLGDAHLLAAYISTGLLAIIFCRRYNLLKIGLPLYCILITIVFIAILLTGSRNGIVTFFVTMILFYLYLVCKRRPSLRNLTRIKKTTLYSAFIIFISGAVIIALYMSYSGENDFVTRLLRRTFYFSLTEDQSLMGRIRKFSIALDLVFNGPILIGVGLQSSPMSFFDGAISSILVSSGLMGLIIFISIIVVFFLNLYKKAVQNRRQEEFLILLFVSLNYILANLITEFFLVSRSVIPFSIFLGLVASLVQIPKGLVADMAEKHECFDNNSLFE